jgi:ATP-dependent helicase HrpA
VTRPPAPPALPFRLEFPPELPITARAGEIVDALRAHQVLILAGETGSGKTTQIPKLCLAAGRGTCGRIACTQPRRVAALSLSRRVAEELGVPWGREVGCKVRFSDQTGPSTIVKFLTDGMLLAEVQGDPLLREYDTVIIDEAHERSLNIDFLLGHLRQLRHRRPDLQIVVTSATIDTAAFSAAFDDAPVIGVEGRMFPVEVVYAPLDALGRDYAEDDGNAEAEDRASARAEAVHYLDGAVAAVERIVAGGASGDVLVFLPSERDIREAMDALEPRLRGDATLVPLFGRLTNAEQQRVFAPAPRRKVVVATNLAETSLTLPGIRFVVDAGLVRVSRYSPQARTRRLPIEPVSQSSAEQRKGRAGRVAPGTCIRLYSEADFLARPRFTQPEIQRANLADVILRLQAFGLGDIERFPFLNPPPAKAIRAGFGLLEELGALGPEPGDGTPRPLTPIGRELARLPVDPTVGRMILQARTEGALREVLVIAAGLSIQDPRERPLDRQAQADAAHRRFAHPDSDFLTLLAIWEAFHDDLERLSQPRLRRFCRDHFLSYTRLREWRDIHAQLSEALASRPDFRPSSVRDGVPAPAPAPPAGTPASGEPRRRARREPDADPLAFGTPAYRAIHRSILAGLLGNLARLDEEHGGYLATHDRRLALFPGSVLFRREAPRRRGAPPPANAPARGPATPRWIMAAEIVETSRVYARTCARLDPAWALDLGAHLLRISHSEPFWDEAAGRVMVRRRTRLYGLELERRAVSFGAVDPVQATEIFLREGLVNDTLTFPLDFLAHNREVRARVADRLTRARDGGCLNLDEAVYRFYAERLLGRDGDRPGPLPVASTGELVALVRARQTTEPRFLFLAETDLHDPAAAAHDEAAFPGALPLSQSVLPLSYAYRPGQADDGVTLEVGPREAEALTPAALDWAVPGHLAAKVEHYLRTLPKELRRAFVPLAESARALAAAAAARDRLTGRRETVAAALAAVITERHGVSLDPAVWADKPLPDHLQVRVRVVDARGRELAAARRLEDLRAALATQAREASVAVAREDPPAWRAARARWETPPHVTWKFDELPARITVSEQNGVTVHAFPALVAEPGGVARRLCRTPEEAAALTAAALRALLERHLTADLMWTQRDLRALRELGPLAARLAPVAELPEHAFASIREWVLGRPVAPLTAAAFETVLTQARADLRGLVPRLVDLLRELLGLRLELEVLSDPPAGQAEWLAALLPPDFLRVIPYARLAHVPRYLRAALVRAERARRQPARDAERLARLEPLLRAWRRAAGGPAATGATARPEAAAATTLRWQLEELRVSLFAQELGTAEPVSEVKLERALAALGTPAAPAAPAPPAPAAPRPLVTAPTPPAAGRSAPLKDLSALGRLLGR